MGSTPQQLILQIHPHMLLMGKWENGKMGKAFNGKILRGKGFP